MTLRAAGLVAGGAGLVALGWDAGWPELTALGAAAIALVALALLAAGPRPRVEAALEQAGLRVVEGSPAEPVATSPLAKPPGGGVLALRLPLDTSRRGQRPIGPYAVVHGDPWSIVRRVSARAEGGVLAVVPRTVPVRQSALPELQQGESELASRRLGEEPLYACADYVLGDEPRTVPLRSSPKAGKLVVKQQVAPAPNITLIVLDTDASAYGSDDQFGSGWVEERFEAAVEVAASLAVAQADRSEEVHLTTT